jgi:tRNA/rRNA methyltransferase
LQNEIERGGRVALVFGPEKRGLTREDLSYCHLLVEIPTDPHQPSMNLGQAVAVCLYELACRGVPAQGGTPESALPAASAIAGTAESDPLRPPAAPSAFSAGFCGDWTAVLMLDQDLSNNFGPDFFHSGNAPLLKLRV